MAETDKAHACCGQDGSWSPKPGSPVTAACMLCPQSPTYWKRGRPDPHVGKPLGNDFDPDRLVARLASIAADPDWPQDLRTEARTAAHDGLDVDDLTDSAIVSALNARIVARARHPQPANGLDTVDLWSKP